MLRIFASIFVVGAIITAFILLPKTSAQSQVPAFPGAEGFGANSVGGRGGKVYEVTNTNDSGTGSLRECVAASGARTCVFKIGGLITINSPLSIGNPNITIAGQTAPGGGITIKTAGGGDIFPVKTNQVIVRYLGLRPGPGGENHASQIAANGKELSNVIFDHNSISWGVDSDIETWYRVINATFSWNIISEGLDCSTHSKGCHSKGIMIGGYKKGESDTGRGSENISVIHNLMAHDGERTPLIQMCGLGQVINNVTYNPYWTFAHQEDNCAVSGSNNTVNWVGNYHKKGPDSTSNSDLKVIAEGSGSVHVYVQGNIGPSRTSSSQPDSDWVDSGSRSYIVTTPASAPTVTTTDAQTAYNDVLADGGAGNSKGLNCDGTWYNRRDAIDIRVINDVKNGTGKIIDDPSQVGGWITPATGTGCTDSDHDGMPDIWETANGLNPNDSSDGPKVASNGYTNIENYLNGTAGGEPAPTSSTTPTIPPTVTPSPTPTPKPGDANGDGLVTETDYSVWLANFGKTTIRGASSGDFNGDGIVDGIDYVIWLNNDGK